MRDFSEPWEPEDIFAHDEAKERRARLDAAIEANKVAAAHEAAQEAERKAHHAESVRHYLGRTQLREYHAAGVEPLELNADGYPKCSLAMLTWIGWTVAIIDGHPTLVRPPAGPAHQRKRREDYGNDQGS